MHMFFAPCLFLEERLGSWATPATAIRPCSRSREWVLYYKDGPVGQPCWAKMGLRPADFAGDGLVRGGERGHLRGD